MNYKKLIKKSKLLFIFLLIFQLIFQSLQVPLVFGSETNEKLKFHEDVQRNNKIIKIEKDKENNLKFKLDAKDVKINNIKLIHQKSLKLTESSINYLKNLGYNTLSSSMETVCEYNENFESVDLEVKSKNRDENKNILISELQLEQIKNPKPQKITHGDVFAIVIYTDQGYYYDYAELSDSNISSMIEKGILEEWRHFKPQNIIDYLKTSEESNKEKQKNKSEYELNKNVPTTTDPETSYDSSSDSVDKPKKRNIPFDLSPNGYYGNYDNYDDENYGVFDQKLVDASSVYEKTEFYEENRYNPLGLMSGFHLVGFGTVTTKVHTNGNILTNKLKYESNFGTKNLKEVSYIKNLETHNSITAGGHRDSILVVGKGIRVGEADNGYSWSLNNWKLNEPRRDYYNPRLWQDDKKEFINLNEIEKEAKRINKKLSEYDAINTYITREQGGYVKSIGIQNYKGINVCNLKLSDFKNHNNTVPTIDITGYSKNNVATAIINVDLKGTKDFKIPGSKIQYWDRTYAPIGEVIDWQNGNAIWNFYDSSESDKIYRGKISNVREMTGLIMSPEATVELKSGFNGSIIAKNIIVYSAESHRTDFTGDTIEYPGSLEFIKKDANGNIIKGGKFQLYRGSEKIGGQRENINGRILFEKLREGDYYLEEVQAPNGYKKPVHKFGPYSIDWLGNVNQILPISIKNEKGNIAQNGKLQFRKIGEKGISLENVRFSLLVEDLGGKSYSLKDGSTINARVEKGSTSGENGNFEFDRLDINKKYYLREDSVPFGYEKPNYVFGPYTPNDVESNLNRITIENKKKVSASGKGKFIIEKIDENNHPIKGADFELKNNSNQNVINKQSGQDGKIIYENLESGTYTLREVTPPTGYEKTDKEWTVRVENDGFTRVDEKSAKSLKTHLLNSSEESSERLFRSEDSSSYILPRSVRALYEFGGNRYSNFGENVIPVRAGNNNHDFSSLYPKNNNPNPGFSYSEYDVGNKRVYEKYENPNEDYLYEYNGYFKNTLMNVAGVNKYLVPTDKPGEYEVHLKVKGNTVHSKNNLGIVIVYDHSASMSRAPDKWGATRFEVAKKSTENFLREIMKSNDGSTKVALVTFASNLFDGKFHKHYNSINDIYESAKYEDYSCGFTSNVNDIIRKMPQEPLKSSDKKRDYRGGTYTAVGLKKAEELLENSEFDNKVVITITDGIPTYSPEVKRVNPIQLDYSVMKGMGSYFYLDNYYKDSYKTSDGERITDNGKGTVFQAKTMQKKGIDMYTVGILISGKNGKEQIPENKVNEVMKGVASNPSQYYNSTEVNDLAYYLSNILDSIEQRTVNKAKIDDKLGEQVIYDKEYGFKLIGYKGDRVDKSVIEGITPTYNESEKKINVNDLNLSEDESCELIYKVHLDIENQKFAPNKFYKTNEIATLQPHIDYEYSKWKFPEPKISASFKSIQLKKSWQNQSVKTSNEEVTFQLQRKIKGQGDGEYKDVANKYIRKKIKDISNTEFTHTFKDLIPFNNNGEIYEYRVIEKGVPNGYDPIIEYDENGNTDIINREIPVVKIKNNPNEIEFTKVNSIGAPLAGATFKLQKEDSHTWKDVEKYKNITSGNLKAKIRMEKLAPGDYRLIETKAPQGFITPDENNPVATFTVDNNGKISSKSTNNNDENKIVNYPQAVDLTLFKYEGNESAQRPLKGAKFKIYRNNSRPNKNNPIEEVIINGVSEWTTKDNGEVTINGLTNGIYWLRETKPPEGYDRIQGFIGKIIVENGNISYDKQPLYNDKGTKPENIQDNKIELKQNTLEIQNKKNYIELEKRYVDNSGREQPLNGAKFGLYKKLNGKYKPYLRENKHYIVSSGHTGTAGQFRFEKLEPGEYAVREEKAPLGFEKIDGNIIKFTVNENGDYTDIENIQFNKISNNVCKIINKRKPMKFYIIKTDSNGLKLSDGILGVKIERLKFNNGKDKKEFNLASDYVDYSSSEGLKSGLEIEVPLDTKTGTYILKETRAPQGFQLSNKEYRIKINSEDRRIELLRDNNRVERVLYEENSSNYTIKLGPPIEIKNKRVEYPNTGGLGTLLFTVIGGGLMVMSSIFIIRKRRRI